MKQYMNFSTGEITESHSEAVDWYAAGDEVEVQRYNDAGHIIQSLKWTHGSHRDDDWGEDAASLGVRWFSGFESLLAWMQRNDPNGEYTGLPYTPEVKAELTEILERWAVDAWNSGDADGGPDAQTCNNAIYQLGIWR